jgi:DNA-directed RNA polymerase subunit RPC12/RpoP
MAMKPCQKCGQKNKRGWKYGFRDATRMVSAICKTCGYKVEFKAKPRKPHDPNRIGAKAVYEIKDGRRYLELDGKMQEVGLYDFGGFWKVCPVDYPMVGNRFFKERIL